LYGNKELGSKLLGNIEDLPEEWLSKMANSSYSLVGEANAKEWFEADLENKGLNSSQATRIWGRALDRIVKKDPEYALANLAESKISDAAKSRLIAKALDSADSNPEEELALISLLDSDEDRLMAQEILDVRALQDGGKMVASPAEWLDVFSKMDTVTGATASVMENQVSKWSAAELVELRSDFGGLSTEQQQKIAEAIMSVTSTGRRPYPDFEFSGDVVRALVINPEDVDVNERFDPAEPIKASSGYAVWLFRHDPAAATKWVSSLPDGEAKLWASKNLADNWSQYNPKAVEAWISKLPEDTQKEVRQHLEE